MHNIINNIENYCLTCLKECNNMTSVPQNTEIITLLCEFLNIELGNYNSIPEYICKECERQLRTSHDFYIQAKKCMEYIENYNRTSLIKEEDIESEEIAEPELASENDYIKSEATDNKPQVKIKTRSKRLKKIPVKEVEEAIREYKKTCNLHTKCNFCSFISTTTRSLSTHMGHRHSDIKNTWCLICNKVFENIEEHRRTHSKTIKCLFCKKNVTKPHYTEHLKDHAGIGYRCRICRKAFITKAYYKLHRARHKMDNNFQKRYKKTVVSTNNHCKGCEKDFQTLELFDNHDCIKGKEKNVVEEKILVNIESEEHIEEGEIKYEEKELEETIKDDKTVLLECTDDLTNSCDIKNSTGDSDNESNTLTCHLCQKTYKSAYKLNMHLRGHTGDLPYKCRYCGRQSANKSAWEHHERTHTKEKLFICNICGKALSTGSVLRTHMKQHTGRPEKCEICEKTFCRKSELRLHMMKHRGERPFLCTECGRSFSQRSHLTEHLAAHTDARPYKCKHCEKAFKKNTLLKQHLQLHTGNKTFKCPNCSYACYKKYRLNQHLKMHSTSDSKSTEEKTNHCPLCGKGLSSLSSYNSHMSSVHNVVV